MARAQSPARTAPRAVTLITGDRVLVSDADAAGVSVRRAPGREQVRFVTHHIRVAGDRRPHVFVIPEDAAPLIASGKVDRRLFDVTLLLDFDYDDAHRDSLPLIVTYERNALAAAAPRVLPGAIAARQLPSVNGVSVVSPKSSVRDVWGSVLSSAAPPSAASPGAVARAVAPVAKLWLDGLMKPVLDQSVPQIGAPQAWALGYEGDGVVVAVLDGGIDETHPDLADRIIGSRNFTLDPDGDQVGHGTHVASIIAGSGAAEDGLRRGVAPGALLLSAKVCEGFFCPESSIIAGMQWAVAEEGARIVNMSLGGGDTPGYDPIEEALSTLSAQYGALFVVSAGNDGPGEGTVSSPGSIAAALTVGAVDRDEQVAFFSGQGLTLDGAIKPELTAPGVDIVAARAAGTELGELVGDDYVKASGTSMAAPHVAGAAAILLDQHPSWGAAELKSALIGSAVYNPAFTALEQGSGRVDVAAALETTIVASAPSLSFGLARWPHDDDTPLARTVTYRNLGPATELTFELDVLGPDGAPAPDGMFRVEPAAVALPAGGSASVRVTADTRAGDVDGIFGGRLVAIDGDGQTVAIPVAAQREFESYDLVLNHLDRQGQPPQLYVTYLFGGSPATFQFITPGSAPENGVLRLPRGHYAVETFIYPSAETSAAFTLLLTPDYELAGDGTLELDARIAQPASVTLDVPSAEPLSASLQYEVNNGDITLNSTIGVIFSQPIYYGALIGDVPPQMTSSLQAIWQDSSASPVDIYNAAWLETGALVTGERSAPLDQLASVHARFAGHLGTALPSNDVSMSPFVPGSIGYGSTALTVEFPHERVEHYYTGSEELLWVNGFWAHDENFSQNYLANGAPARYLPGQRYEARWNEPVFGAQVPDEQPFDPIVHRRGDQLLLTAGVYSDRAGHTGYVDGEGRSRLYRNGELFAESEAFVDGDRFDVPPEPATYRFELDTSQSIFELSTEQRLVWTFQSAHVGEDEVVRPPVLTARFDPRLDERGRAPRGRFCLPFRIARNGQGTADDVATPSLEVSYDDGATWMAAEVRERGTGYEALFDHPAGAEYVSLRASAQDAGGNAVEQTVIRAYALASAP
ncbi:MAG TPA: S8 family serine peptidase [Polyangiaceae bacterium]|nr:S8 family serine peptidase [Polyangiaceae bacterium]